MIVPVILTVAAAAASIIDLRTRRVPNALTLAIAVSGAAVAATGFGPVSLPAALAGALVGLVLMLPGHLLGKTGAGDVKLLAAFGTLLGPGATVMAFLFSAIAGGILAIVVAIQRGRLAETCAATGRLVMTAGAHATAVESATRNNRFAYAPAIAIGAVLAGFGG